METTNENPHEVKQRHGCVTAWLAMMIIFNALLAVVYLFGGDFVAKNFAGGISKTMLTALALIGIANVGFSVVLFQWKKWGFFGFVATSIAALVINLSIGLGIAQSVGGLIGVAVLFGILQIKQGTVSAWELME